jgi:hypothetical protein
LDRVILLKKYIVLENNFVKNIYILHFIKQISINKKGSQMEINLKNDEKSQIFPVLAATLFSKPF